MRTLGGLPPRNVGSEERVAAPRAPTERTFLGVTTGRGDSASAQQVEGHRRRGPRLDIRRICPRLVTTNRTGALISGVEASRRPTAARDGTRAHPATCLLGAETGQVRSGRRSSGGDPSTRFKAQAT